MRKFWVFGLVVLTALFFLGCPSDDEESTPPEPEDNASGSVTSTTSGTIETPGGAQIVVPVGAVPTTEAGAPGTMVFSIERNNDISVTVPTGEERVSDVYQFGPEGFTFARPVEVAVPYDGEGDPGDLSLWRRNPTTGEPEYFSSDWDAETRTVRAQTYVLSPWFITNRPQVDDASGCLHVNNIDLGSWLYACVETYDLEYPTQVDWLPEGGNGVLYAPPGTIGWASEGNWYLPQGTYTFCLQRESEVNPGTYYNVLSEPYTIGSAWHYDNPVCVNMTVGELVNPGSGRCPCIPTPTSAVGTGDIQVTLTWYNAMSLDLDLWVMDPDSEWCYYGNGQAPGVTGSGGQLDRDNLCGNYTNGRPENIYWTTTPLNGQYIVVVDWYYGCGNEHSAQSINVRTVVSGDTRTYNTTIGVDEDMKEITRFNFSGGVVTYLPPRAGTVYPNLPERTKG
ncbi:hypothetical protein IT157_00335 [bacterium]|nr:hypothetical protein [bacterium]